MYVINNVLMLNRMQSYCFFFEPPKKKPIIISPLFSFCPDRISISGLERKKHLEYGKKVKPNKTEIKPSVHNGLFQSITPNYIPPSLEVQCAKRVTIGVRSFLMRSIWCASKMHSASPRLLLSSVTNPETGDEYAGFAT